LKEDKVPSKLPSEGILLQNGEVENLTAAEASHLAGASACQLINSPQLIEDLHHITRTLLAKLHRAQRVPRKK
jgi:hypothetical protein